LLTQRPLLLQQLRQRLLDTRFPLLRGQVQDTHILAIRPLRLLRHQRVVRPPKGQRRVQLLAIHVAGKRSRLPYQPVDDVPVVDPMLVLAPQAWQPLHQLLGVPYLDLLHADPHLYLFTDQARGYRVGVFLDANGARAPHAHPRAFQGLEPACRQRSQARHLIGHFRGPARIALGQHALHPLPIGLPAGEIPAATQQQCLLHCFLEMPMRRLYIPILMAARRVRGLALHPVMPQQRPILVRELLRLTVVIHRQRHPIGPMTRRHCSQGPHRILQTHTQAGKILPQT
jgi:hypothetical protein